MPAKSKYYDPQFRERFAQIVGATGSEETAIRGMGIGRETFYGWKRRWTKGGHKSRDKNLTKFFGMLDDASGTRKAIVETELIGSFGRNPHLALRWLAAKFPAEYGQKAADVRAAEEVQTEEPPPRVIVYVNRRPKQETVEPDPAKPVGPGDRS